MKHINHTDLRSGSHIKVTLGLKPTTDSSFVFNQLIQKQFVLRLLVWVNTIGVMMRGFDVLQA